MYRGLPELLGSDPLGFGHLRDDGLAGALHVIDEAVDVGRHRLLDPRWQLLPRRVRHQVSLGGLECHHRAQAR